MEPSTSPKWSINWIDIYKSLRGGVVVFFATFVTIVTPQLELLMKSGAFDLTSVITALKIAIVATVVELGRRYLTNQQK